MRHYFLVIFLLLTLSLTMAAQQPQSQLAKLKPGETGVKFDIEGRGSFTIRLFTREAPKTTTHFLKLVKDGFYTDQRFHRADRTPKPYLIQVGDPASKSGDINDKAVGSGGSGARIPYEDSGKSNVEGAVGLARITDDLESGDSQFYILLGNQPFLNGHYTVFGQIISGMDVIKRIEKGDRIVGTTILQP